MPHSPSVEDIIKSNPDVDPKQLEEGRELLQKMRHNRTKGSRYKIVPPSARRRAVVGDEAESDPRTVHLKHRR
jgi:hypothetical protein